MNAQLQLINKIEKSNCSKKYIDINIILCTDLRVKKNNAAQASSSGVWAASPGKHCARGYGNQAGEQAVKE